MLDIMDGGLRMQEQSIRRHANTQIDIKITADHDGTIISKTYDTISVFAEFDNGDKSVGEPPGWIVNTVLLGESDITNAIDLIGIQRMLKEVL